MLNIFSRTRANPTIERLYGVIVAQARDPGFYRNFEVPDTLDGRFDMLVLHVGLFFRRARTEAEEVRALGQAVFDRFCTDMDRSLRELGFGDAGVPRQMRQMGEAFYGRAAAYDAALTNLDDSELTAALVRNVYRGDVVASVSAKALAAYVRQAAAALTAQESDQFLEGNLSFPQPGITPLEPRSDERYGNAG